MTDDPEKPRARPGTVLNGSGKPRPGGHKRSRPDSAGNGAGHGPGWGGPAKGPRPAYAPGTRHDGAAQSAGHAAARTAAEAARPHAVDMVEVWRSIAKDPKAPHMARIVAADKLVERAEGKPVQFTVDATGDDDARLQARLALLQELQALARPEPLTIEGEPAAPRGKR